LRITTIIAVIAAVVLLILPVVYGVRKDPKIEDILKAKNAVDKFMATRGQNPARDDEKTSPLVKEAMKYSNTINPPPPPPSEAPSAPVAQETRPIVVTPKFDLIGTSYYPQRPESSYALINEPGKGYNWVKQGSNVEHLVISDIKDGSITVKDGQKTSEMKVPVQESWRNLLKKPSASDAQPAINPVLAAQPVQSVPQPGQNPARPAARTRRGVTTAAPAQGTNPANAAQRIEQKLIPSPTPQPVQPAASTPVTSAVTPQPAQSQEAVSQPPPAPASVPESSDNTSLAPPPLPTEKDIIHTRLMEEVKASKITEQEAKQLEEAATTLEQLEQLQAQRAEKANKQK
jgi:hypothetical protein